MKERVQEKNLNCNRFFTCGQNFLPYYANGVKMKRPSTQYCATFMEIKENHSVNLMQCVCVCGGVLEDRHARQWHAGGREGLPDAAIAALIVARRSDSKLSVTLISGRESSGEQPLFGEHGEHVLCTREPDTCADVSVWETMEEH